jgi:hypothetical protein
MISSRFLLVMVGVLGLSCGGDAPGPASEYIEAYCELAGSCCAIAGESSDVKKCHLAVGTLFQGRAYDPIAGRACLDELRAANARADFCVFAFEHAPSCDKAIGQLAGGSRKPGETCTVDSECAPSSEGRVFCGGFRRETAITTCQVHVEGKEGDQPCIGTIVGSVMKFGDPQDGHLPARAFICREEDGLRCRGGTCVKLKAAGQSCLPPYECDDGTYCAGSPPVCTVRRTLGDTCNSTVPGGECVDGAFCGTSLTCTAQGANGAACTDSSMCSSQFCLNGTCQLPPTTWFTGLCAAP